MGVVFNQHILFLKDIEGRMLGGATLEFFVAGTSTKSNIFYDEKQTLIAPNPIQAGAGGAFPQFFTDPFTEYDVIYRDKDEVIIDTVFKFGPDQALADDIAANTDNIGELNAKVTQNEIDISNIFQDTFKNSDDVALLQSEVTDSENDVLVLQSDVTTLQNQLIAAELDIIEIDDSNHYMSLIITPASDSFIAIRLEDDVTVTSVDSTPPSGASARVTFSTAITPYYIIGGIDAGLQIPPATVQYDKTVLGVSATFLDLYTLEPGGVNFSRFTLQIFYEVI